jgi:hypothetical protein
MDKYFNYMNLLSLSLRENIRCKRYPWNDVEKGVPFKGPLIEPMHEYGGIAPGKTYRIEIEKRTPLLTFRMYDADSGNRGHQDDDALCPPGAERPEGCGLRPLFGRPGGAHADAGHQGAAEAGHGVIPPEGPGETIHTLETLNPSLLQAGD